MSSVLPNNTMGELEPYDENAFRLTQPWRMELENHPNYPAYWFEIHDNLFWRKFVWEHTSYPYIACVIYLVLIFGIKALMKNRSPFRLRTPLILWNSLLGIFSAVGFYRIGQEFIEIVLQEDGLHNSVCEKKSPHYVPAAFWGLLFTFSKYAELGDTLFIVLKKQPLIALQWFHHALVTIFAWVLYAWQEPILRWYSLMNFGVHAIMYPYFALKGMSIKVPEIVAIGITTTQVMQMIAGVCLNVYTLYVWRNGGHCSRNPSSVAFSLVTYFSLWIMFIQFFISKYVSRTHKKNKAE